MEKTIELTCCNPNCGKKFMKPLKEYNRKIKNNKLEFYCCSKCAGYINHRLKSQNINKICPVCGKEFTTKDNCKQATFCSRSCASKGSVNQARRNAGKITSQKNFMQDTHNIYTIRNILIKRESWKYCEIKRYLDETGINHQFEYILNEMFIYDLVLFDNEIIIEFDGPEHLYLNESKKEEIANNNGFNLIRINVEPNKIIDLSLIYKYLN